MTVKSPRFWIAIVSGVAVTLLTVALVDMGRTSPGPLAEVHQRIPELAGKGGCSDCHGGWRETMAEACLTCHEPIQSQLDFSDGLHGAIDENRQTQCALCHSDHHGVGFAIVNRQSFAQLGFDGREQFDHALVGFDMGGAHLELDCSECHENADVGVLDEGTVRFMGLNQDCASCHEDPHEGRMVISCNRCHGQESFDEFESVGHEKFLPLIGGHGDVSCAECHGEGTERELEVLGAKRERSPRACLACHESPHAPTFVTEVAALAQRRPARSCLLCHKAEHESFRAEELEDEVQPEQHAKSGFALEAPHEGLTCGACHDPTLEFEERYPGREADRCAVCHEDPHGGQFLEGPFAVHGCVACHGRKRFEPHGFTAKLHEDLRLPLDGRHEELDCQECHQKPDEETPRIFRGTPSQCEACHHDAHRGFFEEATADVVEEDSGQCALCHGTTTFDQLPSPFEHGSWTGFPVRGAHAQSQCESCHPRSNEPDESGRSFGRVEDHFGEFQGCAGCHQDPHDGQFDRKGLPAQVGGRKGCVRCHDEASFRSFPNGFDHGEWTGFALEEAHAEAACVDCHEPLYDVLENGRTWGRAAGKQCSACHQSPHGSQFEQKGRTDCSRCHESAEGFSVLSFNHNWDSRFRLGEAHMDLACSACHETWDTGESSIVRYRPLPTDCIDCHGVDEDQMRKRLRRKK